ncbi:MAG: rRNA maturation RNase YbeY [Candidatus Omnitrophica bacterium]|nr:rRNA maturation RNase YbeY [Candidatus Omnitrophota bacterium]
MAYEIHFRQDCPRIPVSEVSIRRTARNILRDLGLKKAVLSVLLVDGVSMRALNNRYLRHARVTDVLAFSPPKPRVRLGPSAVAKALGRAEVDFLGDIALCLPTIRTQAKEYGHSFEEELHYCLCHGILHLIGYEDKTRNEFRKMHRKQRAILERVTPERKGSVLRKAAASGR